VNVDGGALGSVKQYPAGNLVHVGVMGRWSDDKIHLQQNSLKYEFENHLKIDKKNGLGVHVILRWKSVNLRDI
jgi:hypothetical protein